jgi:hypothetical protein
VNHEYVVEHKDDATGSGALWGLKVHHWSEDDLRSITAKALEDEGTPADLRDMITAYMQEFEREHAAAITPRTAATIVEMIHESANFTLQNLCEDVKHLVRLGVPFTEVVDNIARASSEVCAEHDSIVETDLRNRALFDFAYDQCGKFAVMTMQRAGLHLRELFGFHPDEVLKTLRKTLTMKAGGHVFVSPHIHGHHHESGDEPGAEGQTIN